MWISHIFDTSRVWLFNSIICFLWHLGLYTMQKLSFLGKIALVSIWFRMVLTQIIAWV